jgi:two-component system cell cycle response regulator DivK
MTTLHALVIDDQASNLEVLGRLLNKEGVAYTSLNSSAGLSATISQLGQIDIVFLDLEMPGQAHYYDTLRELKSHPNLAHTPIIAYTVHTSEIDAVRLAGFDGFLAKPIKAGQFPTHLQCILNGEQVWVY